MHCKYAKVKEMHCKYTKEMQCKYTKEMHCKHNLILQQAASKAVKTS